MRSLSLACLVLLAACRSTPSPAGDVGAESAPYDSSESSAPRALFADWQSCSAHSFEQSVASLRLGPWEGAALQQLGEALTRQDLLSVRAAVLLAHGAERSREALLQRLEARVLGPARESDAGDVVAAAALARWNDDDTLARLVELSSGDAPHPDLEVRVTCAALALDQGRPEVASFLLLVLTAGTPAELQYPIDWEPSEKLAWPKARAAAALARRAGVPDRFQADGPFDAQIGIAEELRGLLARQG